jgi:hypothetical protein
MYYRIVIITLLLSATADSGIFAYPVVSDFPYSEDFTAAVPPALPPGWTASGNRDEHGDFVTEHFQGSNRLYTRNATIEQFVLTPVFDFSGYRPLTLSFIERRSGTFGAIIRVRAILNGIDTLTIGETAPGESGVFVPISFDLPPALFDEDHVRFEYRIEPNQEGTAGTLRIDDIHIDAVIQYRHDLRIGGVTSYPPLPTTGDSLRFDITVVNNGLEPAYGFFVGVQPDKEIAHAGIHITDRIAPDDSMQIELSLPPLPQGIHSLRSTIDYDGNETAETEMRTVIHVTEPVGSFPWRENFDYDDEMLPPAWRTSIRDETPDATLTRSIVHEGGRAVIMTNATREQFIILPPFAVAGVMLRELTFFERRTGTFDATMRVEISTDRGETFVEYATFAHTGETAYVERNLTLDDRYPGVETVYIRFRLTGDGTGTTGTVRFDSFGLSARMNHDLAITEMHFQPSLPLPGDEVRVAVDIVNRGLEPATDFDVCLYMLHDDPEREPELLGSTTYTGELHPLQETTVPFTVAGIPAGYSNLRAELTYTKDMQADNTVFERRIFVRYPPQTVIINEIMYHPRDGQPEYVELYNPGKAAVDLHEWSVRDRETPGGHINRYVLSDTTDLLEPGAFAVLASDSGLFSWFDIDGSGARIIIAGRTALGLSSLGDAVMILDPSGSVVDSVDYAPSWHHPDVYETRGRSLERIAPSLDSSDPMNWSTSADPRGGTPGETNSLFTGTMVSTARIDINPNPFAPTGDGFEDYTVIAYNLPRETAMIRVRIFDSVGRQVRTLANNRLSGPEGYLVWDGRNDNGRIVRLGIYIVLLEAYDDSRRNSTQVKSTVVVAGNL